MHAQLVRLGSGQHLHHGQQAVEAFAGNPSFLVHQFPAQHGDLRHRASPGKEAEFEKPHEKLKVRQRRRHGLGAGSAGGRLRTHAAPGSELRLGRMIEAARKPVRKSVMALSGHGYRTGGWLNQSRYRQLGGFQVWLGVTWREAHQCAGGWADHLGHPGRPPAC